MEYNIDTITILAAIYGLHRNFVSDSSERAEATVDAASSLTGRSLHVERIGDLVSRAP